MSLLSSAGVRATGSKALLQLPQELEEPEMLDLTKTEERFPSSWEPGGPVPALAPTPAQGKG